MSLTDSLFIQFQKVAPQHLISRAVGLLASSQNRFVSQTFIQRFAKSYNIDMSLAEVEDLRSYASFNEFFTRALKPMVRPIADAPLVCPADGVISQAGDINDDQIFQAKGKSFSVNTLLADDTAHQRYVDGQFITVYLSPRDYHRVHSPVAGRVTKMSFIPGDLYSVNQTTTKNVDELFARNERVVCYLDTDYGEVAVVLVGAMIVASIATIWAGVIAPDGTNNSGAKQVRHWTYDDENILLGKGEELGRFLLGSTAVVVLPKSAPKLMAELSAEKAVQMGQPMSK